MKIEDEDALIEASIMSAGNFGNPIDMYHPEYGQILKDGEPTPAGIDFFKEKLEPFEVNSKLTGRA